MRPFLAVLPAVLCTALSFAQEGIHPDELALESQIDQAIANGVEALIDSQYRDGSWGQWGDYEGGKTALCVYALLKCGVDAEHPAVRRAMLLLDPIEPQHTYTVGCMLLAYGAAGQAKYRARMQHLADLLLDWQTSMGDYGYPSGAPDLSNTQYAALGLWTAQKCKIDVPVKAWRDLIDATLNYAEKAEWVTAAATGEHTTSNGGKVEVAGFGYRRGEKASGSMTTAGVSILQICKVGLGSRLGSQRREVDEAIGAGVNWLGHNFAVDKNPGKNGWPYYYLYGLERVGSLTRLEQLGAHWWYVEGARHLLKQQRKDGSWPGPGQQKETRTAFALLFLRRATSGRAATTGPGHKSASSRHLFAAGTDKDDVAIAGAGQQPLAVWVSGFGDGLVERHRQHGLRIVQVEYLAGDQIIGQVGGDPTKAWQFDAFLYRAQALRRGVHEIRARVQLLAPDVPTAGSDQDDAGPATETVLSPAMSVNIRDVFAPWMQDAAMLNRSNLVTFEDAVATASTAADTAKHVCDGTEGTHWVCDASDADPTIEIDLDGAVSASCLMLSQAGSRATDIGLFDRITVVEIRCNKSKPMRVELDPDQLAITTIPLGKTRRVRSIQIRIVERVPGRRQGQAGFTEIALSK